MANQKRQDSRLARPVPARLVAIEARVSARLSRVSLPLLQTSMGLVFIWFGGLKVADVSPVGDLVAATVPFLDRTWFVPTLGVFEVLLGVGLLIGWPLRLVFPTLIGHLAGTFLVLVVQPNLAFQHGNPLLLTTVGEFVVKNIVLITGGLVLASRLNARRAPLTRTPNQRAKVTSRGKSSR
jgi:putative oxidoreductase